MKVLLIDGNPLMWRAAFGMGEQDTAYGILHFISTVVKKFQPNGLVICWDVGKCKWRSTIFPDYKATRGEQREKLDYDLVVAQTELARGYLKAIGLPQLGVEGTEADDLLAWLSEYFMDIVKVQETIIVSSDKDLWQLCRSVGDRRITVYDSLRDRWVDEGQVKELMGVIPAMVPQLKALQGDASDNIPGIKKVGEKTAIKLFDTYGGIFNFIQNQKELLKKKTTAKLVHQYQDIEVFYNITKLPVLSEAPYLLGSNQMYGFVEHLTEEPVIDLDTKNFVQAQIGRVIEINELSVPQIHPALQPFVACITKQPLMCEDPQNHGLWEVLDNEINTCSRCALSSKRALPRGYANSQIMVVGRDPVETDEEKELVLSLLGAVGFGPSHCWFTWVNKCFPENNRFPTHGQQKACSVYLRTEVEWLKPQLVLLLGTEAMLTLTDKKGQAIKHCGDIIDYKYGKIVISVSPFKALLDDEGKENWNFFSAKLQELLS